jgi:tetratricopeptide (TPR) repeat protein
MGEAQRVLAQIAQMIEAGEYDGALAALKQRGLMNTAAGLAMAGNIHIQKRSPQEALVLFDRAVRLSPDAPVPLANRGVALMELGRFEEALACEEKALRMRPDYPGAHFNRGNALRALGRPRDAVTAYTRALTLQPTFLQAYLNRGLAHLAVKQYAEAIDDFTRTLRLRPNMAAAHIGRANGYRQLGRLDEALADLDAGLAIEPGNVDGLRLRCDVLYELERNTEAIAAADTLLLLDPKDTGALAEKARSLLKLSRAREALDAANEILALAPEKYEAHIIRSAVLTELGRFDEGVAELEQARLMGAPEGEYRRVRALSLATLGDPREAMVEFDRALEANPGEARHIHRNRAHLRMVTGDLPEGWDDYEWRLMDRSHQHNFYVQQAPKWNGEPLAGKRILMYGEQGLGDQIQFSRYVPRVIAGGAQVTLLVNPALQAIMAANFPGAEVVVDLPGGAAGFDFQVSLMSMPAVVRDTLETLPNDVPYLVADERRVAEWRDRLADDTGLRVGIIWQGNRKYLRDPQRSIPLAKFARLSALPGVSLYSLQAQVGLEQLDALPDGMNVHRFADIVENNPDGISELAGLMSNLDLVVMSDTGPTHLAGALGRPVWLALPRHPDWRWMRERDDSPWYPTMRLFRQATAGDWDDVFTRIASELRATAATRSASAA